MQVVYEIMVELLRTRSNGPNLDKNVKSFTERNLNRMSVTLMDSYKVLLDRNKDKEDYLDIYRISNNRELLKQSDEIIKRTIDEWANDFNSLNK
jgi:hypothetical protein